MAYRNYKDQIEFLPTIQHETKIALKNYPIPSTSDCNRNRDNRDFLQSGSLLHLDYGRKLDQETASTNPLYALSDILRFVAASELQFLNMLATKIAKEMDLTILLQQQNSTIANLLYNRQILESHIQRIEENIRFIEAQVNLSQSRTPKADAAIESIQKDFQALTSRAKSLMAQYDLGMTIIMNNATIRESQRAILQAEGVANLTRLAFIFIPSSFTASLFGMNVKQFDPGASVEIWLYFVITVPVMLIATLFLTTDVTGWCRSLFSWAIGIGRKKKRTNSFP